MKIAAPCTYIRREWYRLITTIAQILWKDDKDPIRVIVLADTETTVLQFLLRSAPSSTYTAPYQLLGGKLTLS